MTSCGPSSRIRSDSDDVNHLRSQIYLVPGYAESGGGRVLMTRPWASSLPLLPLPQRAGGELAGKLLETEQALSCRIPSLKTASVLLCLLGPGTGTTCLFTLA